MRIPVQSEENRVVRPPRQTCHRKGSGANRYNRNDRHNRQEAGNKRQEPRQHHGSESGTGSTVRFRSTMQLSVSSEGTSLLIGIVTAMAACILSSIPGTKLRCNGEDESQPPNSRTWNLDLGGCRMTGNVICGAVGLAHAATRGHNGLNRVQSISRPGGCRNGNRGGFGGKQRAVHDP